jgi:hypothetical protein
MASIFDKMLGNPRRVGGLPTTSQLNSQYGGFTTPPAGFKFGAQPMVPQVGRRSILDIGNSRQFLMGGSDPSRFGGALNEDKNPIDETTKKGFLERLFTGGSGQAIAGTAGAVANVIGSSMERKGQAERAKLEREQFEYQRKLDEEKRRENDRLRQMMMAQYDQFAPRR